MAKKPKKRQNYIVFVNELLKEKKVVIKSFTSGQKAELDSLLKKILLSHKNGELFLGVTKSYFGIGDFIKELPQISEKFELSLEDTIGILQQSLNILKSKESLTQIGKVFLKKG